MYLCKTELFEIELLICIKMDLAINNLQMLICHKPKQTNKQTKLIFLQNTNCEKVSRLKLYLPWEKWTMTKTLIFLKNISLNIQHTYSNDFSVGQSMTETLNYTDIFLNPWPSRWIFCLGKKNKLLGVKSGEYESCCTYAILPPKNYGELPQTHLDT